MLEVISKELRHYQKNKLAAYQKKNQGIEPGGIVFAGDSLIEFFPLKKYFKQVSTIYNRGIAGIDSQWLLEHIDSHVNDLEPSHVFILIGCNDIGLALINRISYRPLLILLVVFAASLFILGLAFCPYCRFLKIPPIRRLSS